jgi:transcriptional pleiotropic regulator of transition state genes
MKKTYSIRKIDNLGRIVIPMDMRRTLEISQWTDLRFSLEQGRIIIEKATPQCTFCSETENLRPFQDKFICPTCLAKLKEEQ